MKNKKSIIVIIILILITIMLYYALTERTKPIYKLIYYKDVNTKTTNRINIYKNKVVIIKDKNCNIDNCDKSKTTTNTYYYSKNNMQNLKTYIKRKYPSSRYKPLNVYESKLDEIENSKINSIMLGEYYFEISYVDYQYRLEYSKNDSTTYEVYFNEDNMILVKKLYIKDYSIIKIDSYILGFSEENKKILYNYIKQEAKKNDNNTYIVKNSSLKKNEIKIIKSITENDEQILKDINKEPKLLYTISYNGINCLTPVLYLYSDNTYEYFYTFSTEDKKLNPKTGNYNYDMNKLIKNINNYEKDQTGPYTIKDENNNEYLTYSSNEELKELLNSINIKLEMCLKEE